MADADPYMFHQTPAELAKELVGFVDLSDTDVLCEPFRGEGAFYNAFPAVNPKLWGEIKKGVDYRDISGGYDWVITNPPFRLETGGKRVNAFWYLLDYYTQRARKGVAFLANDRCFATLTPRRVDLLKTRGWGIQRIVVCSVKKWRGRYFFVILTRTGDSFFNHLLTNY